MSVIEGPGKEAEPEGVSANRKLELWGYNANLILKDGENMVRSLSPTLSTTLTFGRIWTYSTRTGHSSTLESSCKGRGSSGRSFSPCCSITTVRFRWFESSRVALKSPPIVVLTIREQEGGVTKYKIYQRASRVRFRIELGCF